MAKGLKPSNYNVLFDLDDGTHLAFNAMSGGFAKISGGDYAALKRLLDDPNAFVPANDQDEKFLDSAKRARFVIEDDIDEYELLRLRANVGKYSLGSFHLTIMPTLACNFACPYCYENPVKGKMSAELQEGLCRWVDAKLEDTRRMTVGWFGGEPLLARDVVRNLSLRFVEMCRKHEVEYSGNITTNGYYLTPEVIDELDAMSVNMVQVTIDGPPEVHDLRRTTKRGKGTYHRIIQNLVSLCERTDKVKIALRVNYDEVSIARVPELLPLIPEPIKQRSHIYFRQVFPPPQWWDAHEPTRSSSVSRETPSVDCLSLQKQALDQGFTLLLTGYSPSAGYCEADFINYFVLDPQCNLHKCTVAFDEEHRIGYVSAEGKATLDPKHMAKWMLRETLERDNCRACKILPLCMGGCSFTSLCSDGKKVCSTVNSQDCVVENLKLLYRNMALEKTREAATQSTAAPLEAEAGQEAQAV